MKHICLVCLILVLVINYLKPAGKLCKYEAKIKGKWPKEQASIIHIHEEHYKYILKTKVQVQIIHTYEHSKLTS